MSQDEHYFTARPASSGEKRTIRAVLAGREVVVRTAGGVFSPARVDLGTRVLLEAAGEPPAGGALLDVGCGWGPIALSLALESPEAEVWAVDVNERSLELTAENARSLGLDNVRVAVPDAVPAETRFASILSNPPVRVGNAVLHELLARWLPRLTDDGEALTVVQRNLGADPLHRWLDTALPDLETTRLSSSKGYRVLRTVRRPV